jgi:hypothetical protein
MVNRPEKDEFAPYYLPYVNSVPEGDILSILKQQLEDTIHLVKNVSDEQGQFCYAPGKWSLKEVVGHMTDTEQIMAYRLLCIARGETVSLPGFDENRYVAHASFNKQPIEQLLANLSVVRQSTILLLNSLDAESYIRKGLANKVEVTVRALAYIIAGHALHHCQIINERYIHSNDFPS